MKRERPDTVQTAVRLPREMHERLKQCEHGVSEGIRRRLNRELLFEDALDRPLREFVDELVLLSVALESEVGSSWHSDSAAHAAFKSIVIALLDERKPPGAPVFKEAPRDVLGVRISKSDDPDTIGRALARRFFFVRVGSQKLRKLEKLISNWHESKPETRASQQGANSSNWLES